MLFITRFASQIKQNVISPSQIRQMKIALRYARDDMHTMFSRETWADVLELQIAPL